MRKRVESPHPPALFDRLPHSPSLSDPAFCLKQPLAAPSSQAAKKDGEQAKADTKQISSGAAKAGSSAVQKPSEGGANKLKTSSGEKKSAAKETGAAKEEGKPRPNSSAAPPAAGTPPVDGAPAKKSKNQMKKETKAQTNQEFWDKVKSGEIPDPRVAKAEKKAKEAAAKDTAAAKATGSDTKAQGGAKKGGKETAAAAPSGTPAKSAGATPTGKHAGSVDAKSSSTGAASSTTSSQNAALAASTESTSATKRVTTMQTSYQFDDPKRKAHAKKKQILNRVQTPRELDLFSHMPQSETYTGTVSDAILQNHPNIPAAFVAYGLQIASKKLQGSNARNLGLIDAFMAYLENFTPNPAKQFSLDLDTRMKPAIQYVVDSRPLSVGQSNIIRFLKLKMSELAGDRTITTTEDARKFLIRQLKIFKDVHILAADKAIIEKVSLKIQEAGDVILTFGRSYVVSKALQHAAAMGKKFKVIVLDSNPRFEGKRTLQELADQGIELEYSYINGISYFMKGVTKVLIGASAMMGNGQLFSRAGTSIVCMMAHNYRVPVLVACETYKFTDKVQLDAITRNEVDDPDLLNTPNLEGHNALKDWKNKPTLKMLNLVYDLTPSEFIDMIITEHGPVPSTSVPALIREFHTAF